MPSHGECRREREEQPALLRHKQIMAALIEKTSWKQIVLELETSGKEGWLGLQGKSVRQHSR